MRMVCICPISLLLLWFDFNIVLPMKCLCHVSCLHILRKRGEKYSNLNKKVKSRPNYLKNNLDKFCKVGHEFLIPFYQSYKQSIKIKLNKPKARPLSY